MTAVEVTVVSPLYRTGRHVAELVERLDATFTEQGIDWEAILVDDACPDGSADIVDALGHPAVLSHRLSVNRGQQVATTAGIAAATGDIIVIIDADLQDRPEDIVCLLNELHRENGIVTAGRHGRYSSRGEAVTGRAFRLMRWAMSRGSIPADASMFLAGGALNLQRAATAAAPDVHLLTRASLAGVPIHTVPLSRDHRSDDGSYTTGGRLRVAAGALAPFLDPRPSDRRPR